MKFFKTSLIILNAAALLTGLFLTLTRIPDPSLRTLFCLLFFCSALLNAGCFLYFRRRFVNFSDEVCQSADRILRKEPDPSFHNLETLTSKMVMELEKMDDIYEYQLAEGLKDKEKLQEIISDVSHQLKTPLANIRMYQDMLSEPDVNVQDSDRFMAIIRQQLEKLEFLIDSLVKSSRLESEMIKLAPENLPLSRTLEAAVLEIGEKTSRKEIALSVTCPPDLLILHDTKWTAEAIGNLLDNAVKYTPAQGSITVSAVTGELYVEVRIEDTGSGIQPDHINDIFKRFYREPSAAKTEGLGLGLYITRNIIALQGGYLFVRSAPGRGSCFSVFLPHR